MLPGPQILNLSILIAGVISIIKFGVIPHTYYPFIFCIWIACLNEILSSILLETGHHSTVNNNIYVLAEALFFSFFFKNQGIFEKFQKSFVIMISGLLILWVWENFFHGKITYISSWFRIVYSFLIVLMSITTVNSLIILDINRPIEIDSRHIFKNPVLLICIGSVAYFTFKILIEIFWLYGLNSGKDFRNKVYNILLYINLAVNLIYALAVLWVHPKQQSIARY